MKSETKRRIIENYSDMVGVRELARKLGVSETTVSKALKECGITPVPRGKILEESFNQILEYSLLTGVDLDKMGLREKYRWFRENGFRGSWRKFYQLWQLWVKRQKENEDDREDDL
jgi:DNA-binding transcriptional ArsR family regulator